MGKKSYERHVYESEDDKILTWDITQKSTENRIHTTKGKWRENIYETILCIGWILLSFS